MFRDRDQELDRLNRALLEEEQTERQEIYNFEDDEPQPEPEWDSSLDLDALFSEEDWQDGEPELEEEVPEEREEAPNRDEPVSPLLIAAVILLAFIIGLLVWYLAAGGRA